MIRKILLRRIVVAAHVAQSAHVVGVYRLVGLDVDIQRELALTTAYGTGHYVGFSTGQLESNVLVLLAHVYLLIDVFHLRRVTMRVKWYFNSLL